VSEEKERREERRGKRKKREVSICGDTEGVGSSCSPISCRDRGKEKEKGKGKKNVRKRGEKKKGKKRTGKDNLDRLASAYSISSLFYCFGIGSRKKKEQQD